MRTTILLCLLIAFSLPVNAQTANKTSGSTTVKNIASLQIAVTDPNLGASYERLFTSHVGAEISVGLIGISLGPKFYFPSVHTEKVVFHTGAIVGWGWFAEGVYGYLPLGISRLTNRNFLLSFDIGPHTGNVFSPEFGLGARLKVGKAF